jgi:hypothetical protein
MTTFAEKIQPILTLQNAQEWATESERFLFVTSLIEECDLRWTPARVEYIETMFEQFLAA